MRIMLALAGLCCLSGIDAIAQDKPAEPASVEKLIEQLSSRNYREREAATRALEGRGQSALADMRKAASTTKDPEARRRLESLIATLDRAAILAPKRITLATHNQPIAEVVKELARLSGYPIQYQGGNRNLPLSFDFKDRPFWEVLDRICLEGGVTAQHNEGSGIHLYHGDTVWPHVNYQGPFKLVANSFYYSRTITLGGLSRNPLQNRNRSEALQFSFNIQSEPKLPLMGVQQAKLLEAVDNLGNGMLMHSQNSETVYYSNHGYRTHNYTAGVNLSWPSKDAKAVKLLRGTIPVTLLASQKPEIVVDDILKVKNKKFSGAESELQIDEVKETNNKTTFEIKMTIRNNGKNANGDYTWSQTVHQRVELLDAKGRKYYSHGYNWENSSPAFVTARFMFGNSGDATIGPPARLVYNQWTLMPHQIEFEFRDLPLP